MKYKVGEIFDIVCGDGRYTEEYIAQNPGAYPVISGKTTDNGVFGYIDTYDYNLEECLTCSKDGVHSGTVFFQSGKFSLTSHAFLLTVKKGFDRKIDLEWFRYRYHIYFRKNSIHKFGNTSLPKKILKKIYVDIPDGGVQKKEKEFYKKLHGKITTIENQIEELKKRISELGNVRISIPREENVIVIKGEELFNILLKNSGLTEKFIYNNTDPTKEQLPVYTSSLEPLGFLPEYCKKDGKKLRVYSGETIIVFRQGVNAGTMFLHSDNTKFIPSENAIPLQIKPKYKDKLDPYWFMKHYQPLFYKYVTSKADNCNFSNKVIKRLKFKIPSKKFQEQCISYYRKMEAKKSSIEEKISTLENKLNEYKKLNISN